MGELGESHSRALSGEHEDEGTYELRHKRLDGAGVLHLILVSADGYSVNECRHWVRRKFKKVGLNESRRVHEDMGDWLFISGSDGVCVTGYSRFPVVIWEMVDIMINSPQSFSFVAFQSFEFTLQKISFQG